MLSIDNSRPDPHSYFRKDQPWLSHVEWAAEVLFESRTLSCLAVLRFDRIGIVDLDTRDLVIESVTDSKGRALTYGFGTPDAVLGTRLRVEMADGDPLVRIMYRTSPRASALQWLTPEQTAGKRQPFLFSQAECLHARSFLPCQDSPGVRFTYVATLTVPTELRGLMAATHMGRNETGTVAVERWCMKHPIPAYLTAFVVGDLVSRDLSERSRVWAEPAFADKAAFEFDDAERMIVAAERLFGRYPWERFDILVMPPSFPYGGMENPTLTFLTPTVLAGDRSAVNVVAHELAHGWTGNLVTNATWSDFWINEGWTTYAEMRILEQLYGRDTSELQAALLRRELDRDIVRFLLHPQYTHLRPMLTGTVDPDDTFSRVPYCKGYLFLRLIEETVGREQFDVFIREYIEQFRFQSLTTARFLDYAAAHLPGILEKVRAKEWVYDSNIPDNAPVIKSQMRDKIDEAARQRRLPTADEARAWNGAAWTYYFESVPRAMLDDERALCRDLCEQLEVFYQFSQHGNAEIQCAWYLLAIESGMTYARAALESFLARNGRVKYLRPLYAALAAKQVTLAWAREVFERVKNGYHPIAQAVIGKVLAEAAPKT